MSIVLLVAYYWILCHVACQWLVLALCCYFKWINKWGDRESWHILSSPWHFTTGSFSGESVISMPWHCLFLTKHKVQIQQDWCLRPRFSVGLKSVLPLLKYRFFSSALSFFGALCIGRGFQICNYFWPPIHTSRNLVHAQWLIMHCQW